MNVSLPIPLEEFVRRKVAAGEFHSADEVVCEGLLLLQNRDAWNAEARQKIDVGWQQARSGQLRTPEQTQENLAARKIVWKTGQSR
jgi:putative addiction module CopG family antidote